jgi:hypothetical protein
MYSFTLRKFLVRARLRHQSEQLYARGSLGSDPSSVNLRGYSGDAQLLAKLKARFTSPASSALTVLTPTLASAFRFETHEAFPEPLPPQQLLALPRHLPLPQLRPSLDWLLRQLPAGPLPHLTVRMPQLLAQLRSLQLPPQQEALAGWRGDYDGAAALFKDAPVGGQVEVGAAAAVAKSETAREEARTVDILNARRQRG